MSKPRCIGYIPLYYGIEYLSACIKSMEPFVERILIIYVSEGSQGHRTDIRCPESEEELKAIAMMASPKVEWHVGRFSHEGAHRDWIYNHSAGYDLCLTLDADEIIEPQDAERALKEAYEGGAHYYGIDGFINFWRSFNHVCLDGFRPFRIINFNNPRAIKRTDLKCRIYHFSTCQSIETVRFKWNVSGHRNELKPNWIDGVYLAWNPEQNQQDLHPVSIGLWNTVPFDKSTLPEVLKSHPNYNREQI